MWKKLGRIFTAEGQYPWMLTHAATPFAASSDEDAIRCYFCTRDSNNRAHIAYIDFDMGSRKVVNISPEPILSPGEVGYFDDSGVFMPQILEIDQERWLYYQGWNLSVTVPFRNSIGLAHAKRGSEEFHKYNNWPILDLTVEDPFSLSNTWVRKEGTLWRMWYGSNRLWNKDGLDIRFVLKYAESEDGINWKRFKDHILEPAENESYYYEG